MQHVFTIHGNFHSVSPVNDEGLLHLIFGGLVTSYTLCCVHVCVFYTAEQINY